MPAEEKTKRTAWKRRYEAKIGGWEKWEKFFKNSE